MRTFFCLPLDGATVGRVQRLAVPLRGRTATRASWVRPENYHVTVSFLGEIEPALCTPLYALATNVAAAVPRHMLRVDRLSAFPAEDRPRVVWAGGEAPDAFRTLLRLLHEGLEELGFPGKRVDDAFHITIARLKGRADGVLRDGLGRLGSRGWDILAEKLVLMESRLTGAGAEYDPLFTVSLSTSGGKTQEGDGAV